MRCKFIDVWGGTGAQGTYEWPINHAEEEPSARTLNIERSSPTSGVGFVRQVGDPSPIVRQLKGTILQRTQRQKFDTFFEICAGLGPGPQRTIHFMDQLAGRFEVLITSWLPTAHRAAVNPRGATADERLIYWTYDLTMEVLNTITEGA